MPRWLYFFLIFTLAAPLLDVLHAPPILIFIIAGLGILPLAALIGSSVEQVAEHTGERVGGLLFATFGNATELIIGILALSQGLVNVVTASIIGSILGNVLLVLGISVLVGGFKHGRLTFETRPASQYSSLLALCIGGLVLPTIAELLAQRTHQQQILERGQLLSDVIAVVLLLGYIASILFSVFHIGDKEGDTEDFELLGARSEVAITRLLSYRHRIVNSDVPNKSGVLRQIDSAVHSIVTHEMTKQTAAPPQAERTQSSTEQQKQPLSANGNDGNNSNDGNNYTKSGDLPLVKALTADIPANLSVSRTASLQMVQQDKEQQAKPPLWRGLLLLLIATVGVAILSEILVGAIEPTTKVLGWNPAFVGLIFIPLIGGLPEYYNTITMALDKRIGMVLAASAGSSIQIALLMAPILILVSLFTPVRLDLVFSLIELAVLAIAAFLFSEITRDGELVWLEGLLLVLLYAIMGGTVFIFGS